MLTSADGELTLIKTNKNFAVEPQTFQVRVLNPLLILSLQISAPFGVSKCQVKFKKKLHKLIYNMNLFWVAPFALLAFISYNQVNY